MDSNQLQRLWRLSEIDAGLVEVKKRAAALDPGRAIAEQIKKLQAVHDEAASKAKELSSEQTDLELKQKGIDDKLKRIDKELYGGTVVSPREVEAFEKEVASLKRQKDANDERLLELLEQVPPARAKADETHKAVDQKKGELAEYQKRVVQEQARLQAEFKRLNEQRPEAAKSIDRGLLARYDAIRQKHGGIGMAQATKQGACSMCGMKLPVKAIETAKEGRVATCEACHRILYYTEGLV